MQLMFCEGRSSLDERESVFIDLPHQCNRNDDPVADFFPSEFQNRRRKRRLKRQFCAVGLFLHLTVSPVIQQCAYHDKKNGMLFVKAHSQQHPPLGSVWQTSNKNYESNKKIEKQNEATIIDIRHSSTPKKSSAFKNFFSRTFQATTSCSSSLDSEHDFLQYINEDSVGQEPTTSKEASCVGDESQATNIKGSNKKDERSKASFLFSASSPFHLSTVGGGSVAVASLVQSTLGEERIGNQDDKRLDLSQSYSSNDQYSGRSSYPFLQSHVTDLVHQATEKIQHISEVEPISFQALSFPITAHRILDARDETRQSNDETKQHKSPLTNNTFDDKNGSKPRQTNADATGENHTLKKMVSDQNTSIIEPTTDLTNLNVEQEVSSKSTKTDSDLNKESAVIPNEKVEGKRISNEEESMFEDEESLLYYFNDDLTEEGSSDDLSQVQGTKTQLDNPTTEEGATDYEKDEEENDSDWARLPSKVPFMVEREDESNLVSASDGAFDGNMHDNQNQRYNNQAYSPVHLTKGNTDLFTDGTMVLQESFPPPGKASPSFRNIKSVPMLSDLSDDEVDDEEESDVVQDEIANLGQNLWEITTDAAKEVYSLGLHGAREFIEIYRQQKEDGITDKPFRPLRKATSKVTGLQGFFSGKQEVARIENDDEDDFEAVDDDELGIIRRRIAAIDMAREAVERRAKAETGRRRFGFGPSVVEELTNGKEGGPNTQRVGPIRWIGRRFTGNRPVTKQIAYRDVDNFQQDLLTESQGDILFREFPSVLDAVAQADAEARRAKSVLELAEERKRRARIKEIDRQIHMGQELLVDLQSERDQLFHRPNPLYNYTKVDDTETGITRTNRIFSFPPPNLVDEYLEQLLTNERLVMLNHTYLWKEAPLEEDFDDDDTIGDDLFTPSADARKLYEKKDPTRTGKKSKKSGSSNGIAGGSWLLRQSIGKGESLGEKIGSVMEMATYKAVCKSVMSVLARSIASLHGLNVMGHSDIRIYMENSPDLPPHTDYGNSDTYAQEMMKRAVRKGTSAKGKKKGKRRSSSMASHNYFDDNRDPFLQRDAVVETMLSHCQISAPLLKLFPLPWQRAFLSNIVTLVSAVVSDFASGLRIQVLGHQLTFSFQPITEEDMMEQAFLDANNPPPFNNRKARPHAFEAAVTATANDLSEQLMFLDRWHERALGSGMLRAQLSNLIARIVLTIVDEVLSGTQMNMWTKQASGPRIVAGLEYRTQVR